MTTKNVSPIQLRGLDFTLEEMKKSREKNGLLRVGIAIGNGGEERECNANCPYCLEERESNYKKFSLKEIRSILDQGIELGIKTAVIIGYGEPLLPSRLEETLIVIGEIDRRGLTPIIFTNGLKFSEEVAQNLYTLNASLITTLNSFDPKVQDYLSGFRNALSKKLNTIDILIKTGFTSQNPTRAGIQSVITKYNLKDFLRLAQLCVKNNFYPYFETIKFIGEAVKNPYLDTSRKDAKDVFQSIVDLYPNIFGNDKNPVPPQGRPCLQHYYGSLFVTPSGIYPCSGLPIKIGDIREGTTLKEAVQSREIYKLRHLPDILEGKCGKCPNILETKETTPQCWGGCRGNAYLYSKYNHD